MRKKAGFLLVTLMALCFVAPAAHANALVGHLYYVWHNLGTAADPGFATLYVFDHLGNACGFARLNNIGARGGGGAEQVGINAALALQANMEALYQLAPPSATHFGVWYTDAAGPQCGQVSGNLVNYYFSAY